MNDFPWRDQYPGVVPYSIQYPDKTVFELLHDNAIKNPEKTCASGNLNNLTYQEIHQASTQLAVALQKMGTKKGIRTGIALTNSPQLLISLFGSQISGAIPTIIDSEQKTNVIKQHIEEHRVSILFVDEHKHELRDILRAHPSIQRIVVVKSRFADSKTLQRLTSLFNRQESKPRQELDSREIWLDEIILNADPDVKINPAVTAADVALIASANGPEGKPLSAMLLHKNLTAAALQVKTWLQAHSRINTGVIVASPLSNMSAMAVCLGAGIAGSNNVIFSKKHQKHRDFAKLLKSTGDSFFFATIASPLDETNILFNNVMKVNPDIKIKPLSTIQEAPAAETPTTAAHKKISGFGLTETTGYTHLMPPLETSENHGIGLPLPDTEARIVNASDRRRVLPPGEVGELVIRGPQVMFGYQQVPVASTFKEGWFFTRHLASMDAEGFFYYHGLKP